MLRTNTTPILCSLCLGILLATLPPKSSLADGHVQVFILAGQSNMQGQGVVDLDHDKHYNAGRGNLEHVMRHSAQSYRYRGVRTAAGSWVKRDGSTVYVYSSCGLCCCLYNV